MKTWKKVGIYVGFYLLGFFFVMQGVGGGIIYTLLEMIKDPVNFALSVLWFILITWIAKKVIKHAEKKEK
jgi:hypothetical protein